LKTVLGQKPVQAPRLDEEVASESEEPVAVAAAPSGSSNEEDEALSYFQKLADS